MGLGDALICAGVGAFAYHVYARVKNIESALGGPQAISIGAVLDKPDALGDNEKGQRFGFSVP